MHDVLVHYLEVNFPEIAEQLAHARTREPGNEERAAAAERLRKLIRRQRRGAVESGTAWHEPPPEPVVAEAPTPEAPPEPAPDPVLEPTAEEAPAQVAEEAPAQAAPI